jgi:hypothetical protein
MEPSNSYGTFHNQSMLFFSVSKKMRVQKIRTFPVGGWSTQSCPLYTKEPQLIFADQFIFSPSVGSVESTYFSAWSSLQLPPMCSFHAVCRQMIWNCGADFGLAGAIDMIEPMTCRLRAGQLQPSSTVR